MANAESLLVTLTDFNWHVARRPRHDDFLPDEVRSRYPRLPAEVESFLRGLDVCENPDKSVWFLTHVDYSRNRDGMYHWNEHERLCIDAACGDLEAVERIRAFWDRHFPFMFAVHSDYDYLAIDLNSEAYGQIVHGYMPEPEQPSPVARSFSEFLLMYIETFRGKPTYPLSIFL